MDQVRSPDLDRARGSDSSPHLTFDFQTRRPKVSHMEWLGLNHEERIERYANPMIARAVHPAFRSNRNDDDSQGSLRNVPVDIRESEGDGDLDEPDYSARAANVRRAIEMHQRQELLVKKRSRGGPLSSTIDGETRHSQSYSDFASQRMSVSSLMAQGKAMTRSLSQMLHGSRVLPADEENSIRGSPQKIRVGSFERKPVPGPQPKKPSRTSKDEPVTQKNPRRTPLAELSTKQQTREQSSVSKSKKKVGFRTKVRKTIKIWRGEEV